MNQRILLFIVIFLGFLIVVGTTVVITTVIERSGKVQFFSNSEEKEAAINKNDGLCKLSQVKEVIVISENKIGLHCRGVLEIIDLETGLITHRFF